MTHSANAVIVCVQEEIFLKEGRSLLPRSIFSHGEVKQMPFTGGMEVSNAPGALLCTTGVQRADLPLSPSYPYVNIIATLVFLM